MKNDRVSESSSAYGQRIGMRKGHAVHSASSKRKNTCTEKQYLAIETNELVEFNNGVLEFLPMPDFVHQSVARLLANRFESFSETNAPGFTVCAPFRLKVPGNKYREPDVIFLFNENADKFANDLWTGADIAVEIVSKGGEERDWIHKRADYASAGIAEYWIVEPKTKTVTVLKLQDHEYVEHGKFVSGQRATSLVLNGFNIQIDSLFATRIPATKR